MSLVSMSCAESAPNLGQWQQDDALQPGPRKKPYVQLLLAG
jgi:hypothetical protein